MSKTYFGLDVQAKKDLADKQSHKGFGESVQPKTVEETTTIAPVEEEVEAEAEEVVEPSIEQPVEPTEEVPEYPLNQD